MMDLDAPATRRDVADLRHDMERRFAQVDARFDASERRVDARFDELERRFETRVTDLHRHFDVVAESFKTEFRNLFDWTHATTSSLGERLDNLERDHGARLDSLDTRVTRLERRRK